MKQPYKESKFKISNTFHQFEIELKEDKMKKSLTNFC